MQVKYTYAQGDDFNQGGVMRGISTNPFGKYVEIMKCRVPYDVKAMADEERQKLGMNESEYMRNILLAHFYNVEEVESIHLNKMRNVTAMYTKRRKG